ncbi:MAG: hypothetical protein LBH08_01410 [Puniceicoccales bacterium]|jgi:hypothetical protein|nr:hypothetical protein [Puniceicoccales bacterium]
MKYFYFLSISAFFCPAPFVFSEGVGIVSIEDTSGLSPEESLAVQSMVSNLSEINHSTNHSTAEKVMKELNDTNTNVRADSKEPNRFKQTTNVEICQSIVEKKPESEYKKILVTIRPINLNAREEWIKECQVKIYVGFENCPEKNCPEKNCSEKNYPEKNYPEKNCPEEREMVMFKCSATCLAMENEKKYFILFFLHVDICRQYGILNRDPDYQAIRITTNGVSQPMIIINKEGKDAHQPNSEEHHIKMKQSSDIQLGVMRNVDQLPSYANIKIKNHPPLRLDTFYN